MYSKSMQLRIKDETHHVLTKLKKEFLLDSYDDVIWNFIEPFLPLSNQSESLRSQALKEFEERKTISFDEVLREHEKD